MSASCCNLVARGFSESAESSLRSSWLKERELERVLRRSKSSEVYSHELLSDARSDRSGDRLLPAMKSCDTRSHRPINPWPNGGWDQFRRHVRFATWLRAKADARDQFVKYNVQMNGWIPIEFQISWGISWHEYPWRVRVGRSSRIYTTHGLTLMSNCVEATQFSHQFILGRLVLLLYVKDLMLISVSVGHR